MRNLETNRILKGTCGTGYIRFGLSQDGLTKMVPKHRLLAELFIWNPDGLPCVDHIDRNKLNNSIDNLRWCSYEENNRNRSMSNRNISGEMNIHKCLNHGRPRWNVKFGCSSTGNLHQKLFNRDPTSDEIPDEVKMYRDAYSFKWKGQFCPLDQ